MCTLVIFYTDVTCRDANAKKTSQVSDEDNNIDMLSSPMGVILNATSSTPFIHTLQ